MRRFYLEKNEVNEKKDLKKNKQTWLAKLKNIYANTHGNTLVYT